MSRPGADDGKIGPFLATMLVAGSMIGSGLYLLPASLGAIGSISIFGWIAASLGACVLGLVFCGLTILLPERDGLFSYIEAAFGPGASFVAGVLYWIPTGFGPCALAVTGYLSFFLPALGAGPAATATTLAAIWLVIGANIAGPRLVARLNGVTLLFGLAPILLVAIGGWLFFQPAVFAASWNVSGQPALTAVPNATVLAFFAFLGVENAVVVAPVMRRPVPNAPIATLGGLAIATSVYLAATTVIMGMMPAAELAKSSAPFADAALPLLGVSIAGPVALCAMLKAAGTLGATGLATLESIDNEAVLGQFSRAGAASQTPRMRARILIVTGLIVTVMVIGSASPTLGRSFAILADITVVLTLLVYLVACLALFKTSARVRGRNRLWSRLLAVAGGLFCCGLIASSEADLLIWSAIAVAVVLAAYGALRRLQPSPAGAG